MKRYCVFLLMGLALAFQSCFNREPINIHASKARLIDTSEGSCPYVTKDAAGNVVISWIRKIDTSTSVYCYAVSKDQGKSFEKAVEIPGSNNIHPHGENMPKILFLTSGEIIAVWPAANANPANPYADELYYADSFDQGASWSKATRLVQDPAGYDQRYFDVALLPDGEAAIIWLDNRKKSTGEGSALYFAETEGGTGFHNEHLISEPCCPCCRTRLMVDSRKNIHVLYRAILNDRIRDMVHMVSADNGKTFSAPGRISKDNWAINGCPHTGPSMTENKKGIQFTWFTGGNGGGIFYCRTEDNGNTFSPAERVSGIDARHCQITSGGNDMIIAWNENFFKGNHPASRIGIQWRDPQGGHPVRKFITPETGNAAFPAVKCTGNNAALVAYTETENGRDHVRYKILNW